MKIIIIDKALGAVSKKTGKRDGGFHARVYGTQPITQAFAKTEHEALAGLAEKMKKPKSALCKINATS